MIAGKIFTSTICVQRGASLMDADSIPSAQIYLDGTLTTVVITVVRLDLGIYKYSFEVPSHWEVGASVDVHFSATVDSFSVNSKKSFSIIPDDLTPKVEEATQWARLAAEESL